MRLPPFGKRSFAADQIPLAATSPITAPRSSAPGTSGTRTLAYNPVSRITGRAGFDFEPVSAAPAAVARNVVRLQRRFSTLAAQTKVLTHEIDMTDYKRTGSEADLKAIDGVRGAHVAALNAGDARAWAALFTDDGVQMPPNARANIGRPAIEEWSKGFMSLFQLEFPLAVDEVHVSGDWAFERGTYAISLQPKSGGPSMQDMGKHITIYQRKSGAEWRMARDIWNTSNPPPGQ